MIRVLCLDDVTSYYFTAKTPYEAMQKMKYTLDLKAKDDSAGINMAKDGRCLWLYHSGKTYSTLIR